MITIILSLLKRVNTFIVIIIVLVLLCAFFYQKIEKLNIMNQDLKVVSEFKNTNAKVWKDQFQMNRHRSEVLELNNIAAIINNKTLNEEFRANLKGFNQIKKSLKNIEQVVNTNSTLRLEKTIKLKDTTLYINDTQRVAKSIAFSDKWINISGFIINDSVNLKIDSKDSLVSVVYWTRKWFLGRKKYKIEIVNKNPHQKIEYNKMVRIKKG